MSYVKKGSTHHKSKLTEADVLEIKRLLQKGELSQPKIGERFGVSRQTINHIKLGYTWAHVRLSQDNPSDNPST